MVQNDGSASCTAFPRLAAALFSIWKETYHKGQEGHVTMQPETNTVLRTDSSDVMALAFPIKCFFSVLAGSVQLSCLLICRRCRLRLFL